MGKGRKRIDRAIQAFRMEHPGRVYTHLVVSAKTRSDILQDQHVANTHINPDKGPERIHGLVVAIVKTDDDYLAVL